MPLTVTTPTQGAIQIIGAVVMVDLPDGVTVNTPSGGTLSINGAVILGTLDSDGNFNQGI